MPLLTPATMSHRAPQQYSQPSRKGRKTWRKNVDVSEIQNGLELVRDEVIKGGVIAEKESVDLYTLDIAGDSEINKKHLNNPKLLKADQIIAQRSATPAVNSKRNLDESFPYRNVERSRKRVGYVSHKELTRLRDIADGHQRSEGVDDISAPLYDPWDEKRKRDAQIQDPRFSFLPKPQIKKAPKTLLRKPISLAASGKDVPAVIKPGGGYSYNPMYAHYIERLISEGEREVEAEKERLIAAEAERTKSETVARSAAKAISSEAKTDSSQWEEESAWEGFESGTENAIVTAKQPARKTISQRNRIKRRKSEERKSTILAVIERKGKQAAQAQNIVKALLAEREQDHSRNLYQNYDSGSEVDDLKLRRRKLGRISLPEKQLELVLPDELQDSLRLLKPEGNLVKERYRSLLMRGKVEARRPVMYTRKAKMKATEKWTYKDFILR